MSEERTTYDVFDEFIEKCIIKDGSLGVVKNASDGNPFSIETLNKVYTRMFAYPIHSKGKKLDFTKKIKMQFGYKFKLSDTELIEFTNDDTTGVRILEKATKEEQECFLTIHHLWALLNTKSLDDTRKGYWKLFDSDEIEFNEDYFSEGIVDFGMNNLDKYNSILILLCVILYTKKAKIEELQSVKNKIESILRNVLIEQEQVIKPKGKDDFDVIENNDLTNKLPYTIELFSHSTNDSVNGYDKNNTNNSSEITVDRDVHYYKVIPNIESKLTYGQVKVNFMTHILLHLCNKEYYRGIATASHRDKIIKTFGPLANDEIMQWNSLTVTCKSIYNNEKYQTNGIKYSECEENEKLYIINEVLTRKDNYFNFYIPKYRSLWDVGSDKSIYNEVEALKYKKAIVLYGPPGTSKTYSAKMISESVCKRYDFNVSNLRIDEVFEKNYFDENTKQIFRLQLHENYTYQDFIGGIQLVDNNTVPVEGELYKVIKKCNDYIKEAEEKDKAKPVFLILDEINRTDLSSMFGEVFSAIENRGEEVKVSVNGLDPIKIPDNLYVIGTMNEIDFSLERLDFAMRRRFLWFEYNFDHERLLDIINYKIEQSESDILESKLKGNDEVTTYIERCKALNKAIEESELLGDQYQIGHTFFAEVIDICEKFNISNSTTKFLIKGNGPAKVLWDISIEPMLDAFLGATDPMVKQATIKEFREIFKPETSK